MLLSDIINVGLADALQAIAGVMPASGTLVGATHSGRFVITTGNIVIPHASGSKGFNCVLIAGGAHTVTFNGAVSAAMASGDIMTVIVRDDATGTPTIDAILAAAANKVTFT